MSASAVEFGFVAALEREVSGLTQNWPKTRVQFEGLSFALCRQGNAALICAGTGADRAYAASKVLIENHSPRVIFSVGFAGSCVPELLPGSVVIPASLTELATGREFSCAFGRGHMVTLDCVAGKALKRDAHRRFGAEAVDMEAAGVAFSAAESNIDFAAIKVISDGSEDDLGFLSGFVTPEGFDTASFVAHIAFRPALWPAVSSLKRNSKLASAALQAAVRECLNDFCGFSTKHSSVKHSSAATQVEE